MLNAEIMQRYDLARDWRAAGFYETDNHRHLAQTLRIGIGAGRLIAVTGPIGIGKTEFITRLQDVVAAEKKISIVESATVDMTRTSV